MVSQMKNSALSFDRIVLCLMKKSICYLQDGGHPAPFVLGNIQALVN